MSTVHRTRAGRWTECSNPTCRLKFHVPDLTPAEASQLPLSVLLPLLEIIDPPQRISPNGNYKLWQDRHGRSHRDYDLPAESWYNPGEERLDLNWYQHGKRHREGDKPAMIRADGTLQWYKQGLLHRDNGPAIIYPDGTQQWYKFGGWFAK